MKFVLPFEDLFPDIVVIFSVVLPKKEMFFAGRFLFIDAFQKMDFVGLFYFLLL